MHTSRPWRLLAQHPQCLRSSNWIKLKWILQSGSADWLIVLVNKQHDTFAALAVWKTASDDTRQFQFHIPAAHQHFFCPVCCFFFLTPEVFGCAPYCSLSPAYWKRRVILPPERSWNLLQPKPDGCVHGAVRRSCSPPYDVRKSGSCLSEGSPLPRPCQD